MNPFVFLINTLLDIYILILLLRFLLQQVGADFYNPLSQFIVKVTQKPVSIARRIIPAPRGTDLATLLLALLFTIAKTYIVATIQGIHVPFVSAAILSTLELTLLTINVFIFCIFIQVILSWINPGLHNPLTEILHRLSAPIIQPVRKLVPVIEGIDFSPFFALIGLMFIRYSIMYFFQAI